MSEIFLVRYHGELIPEKDDLVVPSNVNLIIPYCCGLINWWGDNEPEDQFDTFIKKTVNSDKTSFELTINDKPKTHLIGRPNTKFCDNKLQITIEPNFGVGIFKHSELNKYKDDKIFFRHQIAFEECNKSIFDKSISNIDLLTFKNIDTNNLLAPQSSQGVHTDYFEKVNTMWVSLLYSLGQPVLWTVNNVFNQVILPIVQKVLSENTKEKDNNIIFKIINDEISKIKPQLTWNFFKKYSVKKPVYVDTIIETDDNYFESLKMKMLKLVFDLYYYSQKSPIEKQFYQEFFKDWDGKTYKQLYLSDVVQYLSNLNKDKDIIIINNSCQGFSKDTETCHASRCIHLHRNVARNKPNDENTFRYNVKNEEKLCIALNYLKNNGSDKTKQFFQIKNTDITIPKDFFADCLKSHLHVFINYINEYAPEVKSSLENMLIYKQITEVTLKPYVYAIFNTFIERSYKDLTPIQKINLDNIMSN